MPGAISTSANGINNNAGQIVGSFTIDLSGVAHGFLDTAGSFTQIDAPGPPSASTSANGINDAGQIVGTITRGPGNHSGFLETAGSFTQIDVPGAIFTEANGINNAGQIVGDFRDSAGNDHAFLDSGGSFTQIDVPGAIFTNARGINDAGQIVGDFRDSAGKDHGFLATPVFAGTPGKANCHGQSVSALARKYRGLSAAAAALDFPSVQALQEAIREFCEG